MPLARKLLCFSSQAVTQRKKKTVVQLSTLMYMYKTSVRRMISCLGTKTHQVSRNQVFCATRVAGGLRFF